MQFANPATNRSWVAVKKVREIKQTAAFQLEYFGGGIEATVSFVQGVKETAHRFFGRRRINYFHDGVLPNPGIYFVQFAQTTRKTPCRKGQKGKLLNNMSLPGSRIVALRYGASHPAMRARRRR